MMTSHEFEQSLRKDWALICRNSFLSLYPVRKTSTTGQAIQNTLRGRLEQYIQEGEIHSYEITDYSVENTYNSVAGYYLRIIATVVTSFLSGTGRYQVVLALDSMHPEVYTEYPPKAINRWEAIITEIENEIPFHSKEYK